MKAAFIKKTGGPEVIELGDLPMPKVGPNDVLVKVSTVAVNPFDTYLRAGKAKFSEPLPNPYILGRDMVGKVDKVGTNVRDFKPGDRVWSTTLGLHGKQGCFAEYAAVDASILYHAPKNISDQELVSLLHAMSTACLGIIRSAMLKTGEILFVNGGGGNIGSAVIQMAIARGARVFTATSSPEKAAWCKSLGAELVLDYKKDDIEKKIKAIAPEGVDVFWETSRHPNLELAVSLMAPRGRIVLMSGAEARPIFPVGPFYRKECSLNGFTINNATDIELKGCADIINRCIVEKRLKSKIAAVMPLSEVAKAHTMLETNPELWGKIVLTIA